MAVIPIFIPHAGCPHQCVFCNQKAISGQKEASIEDVKRQLNKYLQWIKPSRDNEAAFYGGSFTALPLFLQEELFKPVDEAFKAGIIGSVRLSTRPDAITRENLEMLKSHNVKTIELGVQSLDDEVLQATARGHVAEDVINAVQLIKEHNFNIGIQIMVGMPKQSFESLQLTVEKVLTLNPDLVRIYPLLVIKDTPLEASFKTGEFSPLSLEVAVEQAAYAYEVFTNASINVIRVGLQPDEELCKEGNIIAGPFHPAMGELVQSRVYFNKIARAVKDLEFTEGDELVLKYNELDESKLRGQKNSNLEALKQLVVPAKLILEKIKSAN